MPNENVNYKIYVCRSATLLGTHKHEEQ